MSVQTRPYEKEKGSANALHEKWKKVCLESLTKTGSNAVFKKNIQESSTTSILFHSLISRSLESELLERYL